MGRAGEAVPPIDAVAVAAVGFDGADGRGRELADTGEDGQDQTECRDDFRHKWSSDVRDLVGAIRDSIRNLETVHFALERRVFTPVGTSNEFTPSVDVSGDELAIARFETFAVLVDKHCAVSIDAKLPQCSFSFLDGLVGSAAF